MKEQITIISKYELIDKDEWSNFVLNSDNGTIFQSPEIYEIYQQTPMFSPFVFAAYQEQKIIGILIGTIQSEHKGILARFSSRAIIFGGPLTSNTDDHKIEYQLLSAYEKKHKRDVIYTQFRNLFDISSLSDLFNQQNYAYEEHLDYHIDLSQSEEQLWSNLNSKCRGKIRKGEKANLYTKTLKTSKDKKEAYIILEDVYGRANLPLASNQLFENSIKVLDHKNMIDYIGVYFENKLIGIRIILKYNKLAYDWYGGSYGNYYKFCPNEILVWKVFLKMKEDKYSLYDFGGAGHPNKPYGVRDFKKKFGGKLVNFGRYEKIHKPLLMKVGILGLSAYKFIGRFRNK